MADSIKVNGLAELQKTLNALPDRLGKKVVMQALRKAANVIKKDAQQRVRVLATPTEFRNPGTVKKAIKVRKSKQDKYGVYVGVKPLNVKKIMAFKGNSAGSLGSSVRALAGGIYNIDDDALDEEPWAWSHSRDQWFRKRWLSVVVDTNEKLRRERGLK